MARNTNKTIFKEKEQERNRVVHLLNDDLIENYFVFNINRSRACVFLTEEDTV